MSGSSKSYRPPLESDDVKQGHIRMERSVWDRIDHYAGRRRLSRALIIESAVTEYLDKLERIERTYKQAERENDEI